MPCVTNERTRMADPTKMCVCILTNIKNELLCVVKFCLSIDQRLTFCEMPFKLFSHLSLKSCIHPISFDSFELQSTITSIWILLFIEGIWLWG